MIRHVALGTGVLSFVGLGLQAWTATPATATPTSAAVKTATPAPALPVDSFVAPQGATVELYVRLGPGDAIKKVLARAGVRKDDAATVDRLVAETLPAGVEDGTELGILLGDAPAGTARRLERLSFQAGLAAKITVGRTHTGELKLARDGMDVDARPRSFSGHAGSGLFWSMRAAGVPAEAASEFVQATAKRINIGDLEPGDRFKLVIDHVRSEGGQTRAGPVLYGAVQRRGGRALTLVRWTVDGQAGLFDPESAEQQVDAFTRPVAAGVTSRFGHRIHPILRFARFHQGVDFGARWGTPVVAAADGLVRTAGWSGGYGRQVQIAHPAGVHTSYSHLSQIAVVAGTHIRRGDVLGYVGSSGLSTGPHLHFEIRKHGTPVDPLRFNFGSARLTSADVATLRVRAAQLRGV